MKKQLINDGLIAVLLSVLAIGCVERAMDAPSKLTIFIAAAYSVAATFGYWRAWSNRNRPNGVE